jgi:ribosomal protein S27AE
MAQDTNDLALQVASVILPHVKLTLSLSCPRCGLLSEPPQAVIVLNNTSGHPDRDYFNCGKCGAYERLTLTNVG